MDHKLHHGYGYSTSRNRTPWASRHSSDSTMWISSPAKGGSELSRLLQLSPLSPYELDDMLDLSDSTIDLSKLECHWPKLPPRFDDRPSMPPPLYSIAEEWSINEQSECDSSSLIDSDQETASYWQYCNHTPSEVSDRKTITQSPAHKGGLRPPFKRDTVSQVIEWVDQVVEPQRPGVVSCAHGTDQSGDSSPFRGFGTSSTGLLAGAVGNSNGKRPLLPDEPKKDAEESDSSHEGQGIKRVKPPVEANARFACPFFKRCPSRYKNARTCTGPGWPSVHRVKEHVYRRHALPKFQCTRCLTPFLTHEDLSSHQRADIPCELHEEEPHQGIDPDRVAELRRRRKGDMTEAQKWLEMYQIIFPDDDPSTIPTPYYEYAEGTAKREHQGRHHHENDWALQYEDFLCGDLSPSLHREFQQLVEVELAISNPEIQKRIINMSLKLQLRLLGEFQAHRQSYCDLERTTTADCNFPDMIFDIEMDTGNAWDFNLSSTNPSITGGNRSDSVDRMRSRIPEEFAARGERATTPVANQDVGKHPGTELQIDRPLDFLSSSQYEADDSLQDNTGIVEPHISNFGTACSAPRNLGDIFSKLDSPKSSLSNSDFCLFPAPHAYTPPRLFTRDLEPVPFPQHKTMPSTPAKAWSNPSTMPGSNSDFHGKKMNSSLSAGISDRYHLLMDDTRQQHLVEELKSQNQELERRVRELESQQRQQNLQHSQVPTQSSSRSPISLSPSSPININRRFKPSYIAPTPPIPMHESWLSPISSPASFYMPYQSVQTASRISGYNSSASGYDSGGGGYPASPASGPSFGSMPPVYENTIPDHLSTDSMTAQKKGSYVCPFKGCTALPFQTQYLLNSHANVHSQARPHLCPVKGCPRSEDGKGFKRKNEMLRHSLAHDNPGYVCPFCTDQERKFSRPDILQRHVRVLHSDRDRDDPLLLSVLSQRPDGPVRARRRLV